MTAINTPLPASTEQPAREPEPAPEQEPETPEDPRDDVGRDFTGKYLHAVDWNREATSVIREIGALATRCRNLKGADGGVWLDFQDTERCLSQAQVNLKFAKYHTECPKCLDSEPSKDCKTCKGHGWINRGIFGRLSDTDKKALDLALF